MDLLTLFGTHSVPYMAEAILADKYTQPGVTSVTTYLGGDFLLVEIGQLVAVNNERATVNGVSVDVEFGKVRQTIGLGNQTTNVFSQFKRLLPEQPLLVGQLVATDSITSIMTLIGGGVVSVRGTGNIGKNYYTRKSRKSMGKSMGSDSIDFYSHPADLVSFTLRLMARLPRMITI